MKSLLDEKEAAPIVGAEPKTLANWRVLGIGPKFIKVGRLVRYDPDDLRLWIDARRVQSTSEQIAA